MCHHWSRDRVGVGDVWLAAGDGQEVATWQLGRSEMAFMKCGLCNHEMIRVAATWVCSCGARVGVAEDDRTLLGVHSTERLPAMESEQNPPSHTETPERPIEGAPVATGGQESAEPSRHRNARWWDRGYETGLIEGRKRAASDIREVAKDPRMGYGRGWLNQAAEIAEHGPDG